MSSHKIRQVEAITNGTVIDHIPSEVALEVAQIISQKSDEVFIGINLRSSALGTKGVVKIANRELSKQTIGRIALIAPQATICIIKDYQVVSKYKVPIPDFFVDIAKCPNPNCICNHEDCLSRFELVRKDPLEVRCQYCERLFMGDELKKY